jgi:hypothetical protein
MDAQELRGVEPASEIREALIQQMPARTAVQLNVMVGRFDPFDGLNGHEIESFSLRLGSECEDGLSNRKPHRP